MRNASDSQLRSCRGRLLLRFEVDFHAAGDALAIVEVAFGDADQIAVHGGPAVTGVGLVLIGVALWHGFGVRGECYLSPAMRNPNRNVKA